MKKKKKRSKQKLKWKLNIIFRWVIVSFLMQTGILFYLSNYYFTDETEVTFKAINQVELSNRVDIELPEEAKEIAISSSGRYASYYIENTLHVINLVDGKDNVVELEENLENTFVKWYESEDKLIISEKKSFDGENRIKIYTYQAKDNLKQEALDFNNRSRLYKLPSGNSKIINIELNTLNTILYVKSSGYNGDNISRLDISDGLYKLPIYIKNIGDYFIIKQQDEVVFDNLLSKKVFISNSSEAKEIVIDNVDKSKLLFADNQGIVYIGQLDNDKIKGIYYKNYNEENSMWKKIELQEPLNSKDIHIFGEEYIYYVDNLKGIVINLKSNKETKFTGRFMDMSYNNILSLKDKKIVLTNLK